MLQLQIVKIFNKDDLSKNNCEKYENKCLGNSNVGEDVDCYKIGKLPKENAYNIDKIGDGILSCCQLDLDPIKSITMVASIPLIKRKLKNG